MDEEKMTEGGRCSCAMPGVCHCPHHKIGPALVILIGLAFLLNAMGFLSAIATAYIWPILLIAYGIVKWTGGKCSCYRSHY